MEGRDMGKCAPLFRFIELRMERQKGRDFETAQCKGMNIFYSDLL